MRSLDLHRGSRAIALSLVLMSTLGGAAVQLVSDLMREIMESLGDRKIAENAVPEHHSLLRTLQCVVEYRRKVFATLR